MRLVCLIDSVLTHLLVQFQLLVIVEIEFKIELNIVIYEKIDEL